MIEMKKKIEGEPLYHIGDKVAMMHPSPTHGMGGLRVGDIGTVVNVRGDDSYEINFMNHKAWTGEEHELMLVERAETKEELYFKGTSKIGINGNSILVDAFNIMVDKTHTIENKLEEKEEKEMKIIELYKDKEMKKIENIYTLRKESIEAGDLRCKKAQSIIDEVDKLNKEMTSKNYFESRPVVNISYCFYELLTEESINQLENAKKEKSESITKLVNFIDEVEARLELCDANEESKVDVLKKYEILDKQGKLK